MTDKLLTTKEAAELLSVSPSTLIYDRYVANQDGCDPQIPFIRLMKKSIRYRLSDLQQIIEGGGQ